MSLVGNYSTQFLHNFHPHLLQTLNHGMLAANGAAAAAAAAGAPGSYFASERSPLGKPSVLSNFSLPSAFSPPKYIGISLDQVSDEETRMRRKKDEMNIDREETLIIVCGLAVVIIRIEFCRIFSMAANHFARIRPVPRAHHTNPWRDHRITMPLKRVKARAAITLRIPGI